MHPAIQGLLTIALGVSGCLIYFYGSNFILDKLIFPARSNDAGKNINRANQVRPWLFLFPALFVLTLYLAYPVYETLRLSLMERVSDGYQFVGFDNYAKMFAEEKFWEALKNNALWLVVVPAASTAFGLLAAQLTDRIFWGNLAKSLIFMPMAISFVGASVIFKLIYDARPIEQAQIGVLNSLWLKFEGGFGSLLLLKIIPTIIILATLALCVYMVYRIFTKNLKKRSSGLLKSGLYILLALLCVWLAYACVTGLLGLWTATLPYGKPQTWLTIPFYNNFFLMVVLIWIQTGFAMVILSAALRGIPEETVEAAVIDGANPLQIFFKIKVPQISGTIIVVWTTITLVVLKVFDIVFAMTNGQWETQVLANYMYDKLFRANDWGMGSASAMIIMLLVMPILIWNIYNARKEMR